MQNLVLRPRIDLEAETVTLTLAEWELVKNILAKASAQYSEVNSHGFGVDELGFDLPEYVGEPPCYRQLDPEDGEWQCMFGHTGCLYNSGDNTCMHYGQTSYPQSE